MDTQKQTTNPETINQAAEWIARIGAEDVSERDWQELRAWLDKDATHRDVFESMQAMSGSLRWLGDDDRLRASHDRVMQLAAEGENDSDIEGGSSSRKLGPSQFALAAGVLLALVIPILYFIDAGKPPAVDLYQTAVGQRQSIELKDGSSMELSADTRVMFLVGESERQMRFRRGEIYLDVVPDSSRPLSIEVGSSVVTVTGTAIGIRYRDSVGRITVHEGSVTVDLDASGGDAATTVQLEPGEQLTLSTGAQPVVLSEEQLRQAGDWRNGWLHFQDETLAAVVAELAPFVDKRIVLTSRDVQQLRVGGSFNVDRLDVLWSTLEGVIPVTISEESDRIVIGESPGREP